MSERKEITVRIAVCVDPSGGWCAAGWGNDEEGADDKRAMEMALDGVRQDEARYWVEVTLALPSVPVVNAVAEPAE